MPDLFIGIIISALGGGLLTGFSFLLAFGARFARMEQKLDNFCEKLDNHISNPPVTCAFHSEIVTEQGRQDERLKTLERSTK